MDIIHLRVNPDRVEAMIDPMIYGHFLEHICDSVANGLWGEQLRNPSFEDYSRIEDINVLGRNARWRIEGDELRQMSPALDCKLLFGDATWRNYEVSFEAQNTSGIPGWFVIARAQDEQNCYQWHISEDNPVFQHSLQSWTDGTKTVLQRLPELRPERGRWYTIRLRLHGDHLEGWVDDTKLLDIRDATHAAGCVGVGTWHGQAAFRNFRVVSLENGFVFFQGLPAVPERAPLATYWQTYSTGPALLRSVIDTTDAVNGEVSQYLHIEADDGWAGILQDRVHLRAGETYHISAWLKGNSFSGAAVIRLVDQAGQVLAESILPELTREWRQVNIAVKSTEETAEGALAIAFQGRGEVWVDLVSLMSRSALELGGFRPDLFCALKDLRPTFLRYPGGSYACVYHWKNGIGPRDQRGVHINIWSGTFDHAQCGTDEFIEMCRRLGAEPILVVNSGYWDDEVGNPQYLQDALDWIEYCNGPETSTWGAKRAAHGHPEPYGVKYWEIDNEAWGRIKVEEYARIVQSFAPAMRKQDPNITLLACGSCGLDNSWGKRIIDLCGEHVDILSSHFYEMDPDQGHTVGPERMRDSWVEMAEYIRNSEHPNISLAETEWQMAVADDWRNGIYAGGFLIEAERNAPDLAYACPAILLINADAYDFLASMGWIIFDRSRWCPGPSYVVMRMFRDCYASQRIQLDGELAKMMYAVATMSDDRRSIFVKLTNATAQTQSFRITLQDEWLPASVELRLVATDGLQNRNTLDIPSAIREERRAIQAGREMTFELPAYSVAVLCVSGLQVPIPSGRRPAE